MNEPPGMAVPAPSASGTQIMIPWGVGIVQPYTFDNDNDEIRTGTCFYNLHTHDRSGIIHNEAAKNLNLTLGNFFDIGACRFRRSMWRATPEPYG